MLVISIGLLVLAGFVLLLLVRESTRERRCPACQDDLGGLPGVLFFNHCPNCGTDIRQRGATQRVPQGSGTKTAVRVPSWDQQQRVGQQLSLLSLAAIPLAILCTAIVLGIPVWLAVRSADWSVANRLVPVLVMTVVVPLGLMLAALKMRWSRVLRCPACRWGTILGEKFCARCGAQFLFEKKVEADAADSKIR